MSRVAFKSAPGRDPRATDPDESFTIETFNIDKEYDPDFDRAFDLLGFCKHSNHQEIFVYPHSMRFRASMPKFTGPGIYAFQEVSRNKIDSLLKRILGYTFLDTDSKSKKYSYIHPHSSSGFHYTQQASYKSVDTIEPPRMQFGSRQNRPNRSYIEAYHTYNMILWGPEFEFVKHYTPKLHQDFNDDKKNGTQTSSLGIRTTEWIILRYKATNKYIAIICVHLQVPVGKNTKNADNLKKIMDDIIVFRKNYPHDFSAPIIIGDFNLKYSAFMEMYNAYMHSIPFAIWNYNNTPTNFKSYEDRMKEYEENNKSEKPDGDFNERLDYGLFGRSIEIKNEKIYRLNLIRDRNNRLKFVDGAADHAKVQYTILPQ